MPISRLPRRGAHERGRDATGERQRGRRLQSPGRCCWSSRSASLAFIAMLVLGAYAPDLRSGHNGGSHALSNAATGFSGLVRLAEADRPQSGDRPLCRRPRKRRPGGDHPGRRLAPISARSSTARGPRATLVVLPKWSTLADQDHPGWVRVAGLASAGRSGAAFLRPASSSGHHASKRQGEPLRESRPAVPADVHFLAPAVVQTMSRQRTQAADHRRHGGGSCSARSATATSTC